MSDITDVSDETFEAEVLNSDKPVLVDFWAPWCAPCRMLAPTIDEIARDYAGRAKVVKMNVDDSPVTPSKFNIKGIPTLLLFKEGDLFNQVVGATSKDTLVRMIDAAL